ncbi:hypothetical protein ACWGJQ_24205 [Peribacillus simplex]
MLLYKLIIYLVLKRRVMGMTVFLRNEKWGFPVGHGPGLPIHLTESELGSNFSLPGRLPDLEVNNPIFRRIQEMNRNRPLVTPKVIAVFYAPFSAQTDRPIGIAYSNVGFPNQQTTSIYCY